MLTNYRIIILKDQLGAEIPMSFVKDLKSGYIQRISKILMIELNLD